MQKIFGWAALALLLAATTVVLWSRAIHRSDLGLGAAAVIVAVLLTFFIMDKRRAARDPEYAAKLAQAKSDAKFNRLPQYRASISVLEIAVPMLLLSLPIWYWLQTIQPDTPTLQSWRSADIQRLALAGGLILTLMGHGLLAGAPRRQRPLTTCAQLADGLLAVGGGLIDVGHLGQGFA